MDKTQFCCEPYKKMAQTFQWFSYDKDGMKIFCMPSIKVDGTFWRVDHCPSCGKPTRSIEVPEDEFQKIMSEILNPGVAGVDYVGIEYGGGDE